MDVVRPVSQCVGTFGLTPHIRDFSQSLLDTVPATNVLPDQLKAFVDLLGRELRKCFPSKASLPKKLYTNFKINVNVFLNGPGRGDLVNLLQDVSPSGTDINVIQWFVGSVVMDMTEHVALLLFRTLSVSPSLPFEKATPPPDRDNPCDEEFQQTVHYVGGYTVRRCINCALRAKKTEIWQKSEKVLRQRFLCQGMQNAPPQRVIEWTQQQDRGGLMYIPEPVWVFLMSFTGILKSVETPDGSVLHTDVWSALHNCSVTMMLWSELCTDVRMDVSDFLLREITQSFTNTWGNGAALRLKNTSGAFLKNKQTLRNSVSTD